jgi:hypothetical protein
MQPVLVALITQVVLTVLATPTTESQRLILELVALLLTLQPNLHRTLRLNQRAMDNLVHVDRNAQNPQ